MSSLERGPSAARGGDPGMLVPPSSQDMPHTQARGAAWACHHMSNTDCLVSDEWVDGNRKGKEAVLKGGRGPARARF